MRVTPVAVAFTLALALGAHAQLQKPVPKRAEPKAPAAVVIPASQTSQFVRQQLRTMTLQDRVAQLVIGVCYGDAPGPQSAEFAKYKNWVRTLHLGGLIVNNRVQYGLVRNAEPHAMALFLNQMQKLSRVPLIVGGDFERGVSMRVSDSAKFPFNMAYGAARDLDATRELGRITANEARALGVHWIFAPVSDVNNNPANPVINIRSYSENPEDVSAHVAAFIDGAHMDSKNPVLVSAKHFPGHGDTSTDSHFDLPRLNAPRERIDAVEFAPFRAAIAHNVDAIMTGHVAVPALDPDGPPATVSKKILTGILREELGFKGLVVTDAMDMAGLSKQIGKGEAAVRAIEAGADVLLMPPDPEIAIRAIMAAIKAGRIKAAQIDRSAQRVMEAKVRVGLYKKRLVEIDKISGVLEADENLNSAQTVADHAVTLVRNQENVVPLSNAAQSCLVISSGLKTSSFGQKFAEEYRNRAPQVRAIFIDNTMPAAALDSVVGDTSSCSAVVFATYTTSPKIAGALPELVERLSQAPAPVIFVSFGNPYLATAFPKIAAYLAAFSTAPTSEIAMVRALLNELPITGHLPVSIEGFGQYGDGIQVQPALRAAKPKTPDAPTAN